MVEYQEKSDVELFSQTDMDCPVEVSGSETNSNFSSDEPTGNRHHSNTRFHHHSSKRRRYDTPSPPHLPTTSSLRCSDTRRQYGPCSSCARNSAALKSILQCLQELKLEVRQNTLLVQKLENTVPEILDVGDFPVNTIEEMINLNQSLEDKEEFSKLVKVFGFLGGKNPCDAIRRILTRLISTNLAMQMNWAGGETKRSIQEFKKVLQLVAASVRQNRPYCETSQASVEDTIKNGYDQLVTAVVIETGEEAKS